MGERIRAVFSEPEAAHLAARELVAAGVESGQISVASHEPFLVHGEPVVAPVRSYIGIFTLAGAVIGTLVGWGLVYYTSRAYPIATGGMPIVPGLTTGLVMYETAAVGAVLFAFGRFLREARLLGRSRVKDDEIAALDAGGLFLSAVVSDSERVRAIVSESGGRLLDEAAEAVKEGKDGESGRVGKDGSPLS